MILPIGVVRSGKTIASTGVPCCFSASTSILHCDDFPAHARQPPRELSPARSLD